ncbi:hypothetical protein V8D89_013865 [Ganoderma adspersum]
MSSYYTVTSVVGAASPPGSYSPDIYYLTSGGKFVLNDAANSTLNTTHPIRQITVFTSSQRTVDGLTVTYNLEGGNTAVMNHGSSISPLSDVVPFGENEVLAAVYGYAGFYAWYRGNKVGSIAFVIFDTETKESRTVGPFGDTNREQSFSEKDVLAFGSFGQNTSPFGLSGLVFFKNSPNSAIDTALIPVSDSTN